MNNPTCKLCGASSIKLIYATARDYVTHEVFQVWQCENCAVAFTQPVPNDLSPYYPTSYRRYHPFILNIIKFLYRQRVKKWAKAFQSGGVALEVGCGDGLMLDTLRRLGWKVFGTERTVQAASFARSQLQLPIFVGGLDCLKPVPQFDLIFLFQVLEHMSEPALMLNQVSQLLKPGGRLVIGVPNFGGWQSTISRENWFHLDVPRHLYHFSPKALEFCLKNNGLEISKINFNSPEHDPFGWVQSLLNKVDHKSNRLTRFLMQLDPPDRINLLHFMLAFLLGIISLPLALLSWLFRMGALIEITATKS